MGPAVDAASGLGIGAKVLRGKGSFDAYLSQTQVLLFSLFLGPSISNRHVYFKLFCIECVTVCVRVYI